MNTVTKYVIRQSFQDNAFHPQITNHFTLVLTTKNPL